MPTSGCGRRETSTEEKHDSVSLMCDDIHATRAELEGKGATSRATRGHGLRALRACLPSSPERAASSCTSPATRRARPALTTSCRAPGARTAETRALARPPRRDRVVAPRPAHGPHGHSADRRGSGAGGRGRAASSRATTFAQVLSSPCRGPSTRRGSPGFADRVETTDDLLEWDYGADEGRTTAEIRLERPGWTVWRDGPKDGETADEVAERVDRVIARVARRAAATSLSLRTDTSCASSRARWIGEPPTEGRLFALSTATVSVLGWERETAVIERWNEACGT